MNRDSHILMAYRYYSHKKTKRNSLLNYYVFHWLSRVSIIPSCFNEIHGLLLKFTQNSRLFVVLIKFHDYKSRVRAYLSGLGYLALGLQLGSSLPPLQYPLILLRIDVQRLLLQELCAWQRYALELSNSCLYTKQLIYNSWPPPGTLCPTTTVCAGTLESLPVRRTHLRVLSEFYVQGGGIREFLKEGMSTFLQELCAWQLFVLELLIPAFCTLIIINKTFSVSLYIL